MRRGLDWYKRDPIAFLDGVQGMGPELIGAYAVILDLLYARAGQMPRDDRHLSGVMGCSMRKATALTDALIEQGKVHFDGCDLSNSRVENDAKPRRNLSETRANAGRRGGEISGEVRRNKALAEANASSKHEAEKRREEPPISPTLELTADAPPERDRFEDFWSVYPKREAKGDARRAWAAAIRKAKPEAILDGVKRYARQVSANGTERRFIKLPGGWLRDERWNDVPQPPTPGSASATVEAIRRQVMGR